MQKFQLTTDLKPKGDQLQAINKLTASVQDGVREQVLMGVTGSGKTFTMANVIANINKPTLVISHNKTLAAQLYQEFREFFPHNAVSYFVSYYDYYQPEAYIPQTDTYIEKETEINEEIDMLRLSATTNLLTRNDTIVVASVSCIYNIGSPREYGQFVLELRPGMIVSAHAIATRLVELQYERNNWEVTRGVFRARGGTIDLFPAYEHTCIRMMIEKDHLTALQKVDPITGNVIENLYSYVIYPAKHYMTDPTNYKKVFAQINEDMEKQAALFTKQKKYVEAQRIRERVDHDLEMIQEIGYVNGIENYSRYFDGRNSGDPPYTLFDYYQEAAKAGWLLFIDESHMTIPQIRGMYHGDRSRKQTLIDYGFRLPAAIDNRPLMFDEFLRRLPLTTYVSATPDDWELQRTATIVEQLVRPTGLVDPAIEIRPAKNQVEDLKQEIIKRSKKNERTLVTTLTKQMAEDLTAYFKEHDLHVQYLHSDIQTLDRTEILINLRKGAFDVLIGVNLLREGLDLPEVSLVAILDADKEGFLRSRTSLIQTMGRAARHKSGLAILYADTLTNSIKQAVKEVERRRTIQLAFNKKHHITPYGITKPIRENVANAGKKKHPTSLEILTSFNSEDIDALTPLDRQKRISLIRTEMRKASHDLDFELAVILRDVIIKLST